MEGNKVSRIGNSLINSRVMQGVQKFGDNVTKLPFVGAIMGGVQSMLGIMMVSALSQVVCAALVLAKVIEKGDYVYNLISTPYNFGMGLLSLWLCVAMAYIYAGKLKLQSQIVSALTATISFFIAADVLQTTKEGTVMIDKSYLSSTGMITVFFVVFISCRIIHFFESRNLTFRLPKGCPEALISSFVSMFPLFANIVVFFGVSKLLIYFTGYTIPAGIMAVLAMPFSAMTSVPGMFVITFFMAVFTFLGISSPMVVGPVLLPLIMQALTENAALYNAGQELHYYPVLLFYCMGVFGVLPLIFLGLRSKSGQIRNVCRAGLIPACFTVNDVVLFGMPIIYNPILGIPYILNQLLCVLAYHIMFSLKLLTPMWIYVTGNTPLGIKEFLWSMDWRHIIFAWVLVIPAMLVYYPFFKIYEKELIEKEQKAAEQQNAEEQ